MVFSCCIFFFFCHSLHCPFALLFSFGLVIHTIFLLLLHSLIEESMSKWFPCAVHIVKTNQSFYKMQVSGSQRLYGRNQHQNHIAKHFFNSWLEWKKGATRRNCMYCTCISVCRIVHFLRVFVIYTRVRHHRVRISPFYCDLPIPMHAMPFL